METDDLKDTTERIVRKRFVFLWENYSLQVKSVPWSDEIKFWVMRRDENDGWIPLSKITIPASRGRAVLKALGEVLENKEVDVNGKIDKSAD